MPVPKTTSRTSAKWERSADPNHWRSFLAELNQCWSDVDDVQFLVVLFTPVDKHVWTPDHLHSASSNSPSQQGNRSCYTLAPVQCWWLILSICHFHVTYSWPLRANMTSWIKPKVYNTSDTSKYKLCYTHTRLMALCPGLPGWAGTRKVQTVWILLKQETVSGSGISWTICKSAPRSRQITMPAPHHSVFYRPDALPATQPTTSKHWKQLSTNCVIVVK